MLHVVTIEIVNFVEKPWLRPTLAEGLRRVLLQTDYLDIVSTVGVTAQKQLFVGNKNREFAVSRIKSLQARCR
jgi:hypothetical protein